MNKSLLEKYRAFPTVTLEQRDWPNNVITKAPIWCSVDLRDGNQALVNPMTFSQKLDFFKKLVAIGFREIEIGFPSASETEYQFTRGLLENNLLNNNLWPQVLVQARENLIDKTFAALDGYKQAIVHLYNSTSEVQRRIVFGKDKKGVIQIATEAAQQIKELAAKSKTQVALQYSPESFTATELDFAVEICQAVSEIWQPTPKNKLILNLPATVELSTPNIYADQIEWFIKNLENRESHIISVHTHNDRGTGIAATELAILAGAERVEGTLFGNGERTGNLDIVTAALNLFTQGIDPELDFHNIETIKQAYCSCTGMDIHARHPYAGELVFTAFSGSHQDAIKKGMDARKLRNDNLWEVPYLPIDPADIGRTYEAIIRINSQSGKGGVAYILQSEFDIELPKEMHPEFGLIIQKITDQLEREILPSEVHSAFVSEYLEIKSPLAFKKLLQKPHNEEGTEVHVTLLLGITDSSGATNEKAISAIGNGPINACKIALDQEFGGAFEITHYSQRALAQGSESSAIAFIEITQDNISKFGVGIDNNTTLASIKALVSAYNRLQREL